MKGFLIWLLCVIAVLWFWRGAHRSDERKPDENSHAGAGA